jgi:hypothetical protein
VLRAAHRAVLALLSSAPGPGLIKASQQGDSYMPFRGSGARSIKRAQPRPWSIVDARKKPTSEVAEAIAAVEARKAAIAQRAKILAQQPAKSLPKRKKRKKRPGYIAKGEERDMFNRGYRLKGSGWAGKGQR